VLVFTAYDADDDVLSAIRGGARGYLLKGSPAAEIAEAIRQVQAGASYLSPRIAAKLVGNVAQRRGTRGLLSPREGGVLRLVAAGLSNKQIAQALKISERTVKFHVNSIFNKLGADNRAQAVALAAERGLLSGP
jgi:DNA-binding NarL/FixJ family response regulator